MKSEYGKAKFTAVAKAMGGSGKVERLTASPEGFHIDGLVDGVMVSQEMGDGDFIYTLLYAQDWNGKGEKIGVRGMTGFNIKGAHYNFDRIGVDDSWYPLNWDGAKGMKRTEEVCLTMSEQLEEARAHYKSHQKRQADGVTVNFGPTTRTLLPAELERYKETVARRGGSFSLNPSGFGTGYRFYQGPVRNRYGQAVPASAEARKLLNAPALVYDTTDCD